MIDLLPDEHVKAFIEQRKRKFELDDRFFVLTSFNHVFKFWADGDTSILDPFDEHMSSSHQPEIAKLYGVEYDSHSTYIKSSVTREYLYNLFINDPECLFFYQETKLLQEFKNRGAV